MLAQTYSKIDKGKEKGRKKYIKFPCYVQPKLDGVRCISSSTENCEPYYTSRMGKEFTTLQHLDLLVHEVYYEIGYPLDGEIYTHNVLTFQDTVSAIKAAKENSSILRYHIYDIVAPELTFEERHKLIKACLEPLQNRELVYVPTYEVKNEAEIIKYHEQFVEEGYEGIIIRNKDGKYVLDHRSNDLQKWKNFIDKEFVIVGGKEATGEDKGTVVFICDVGDGTGRTFDVRPRGSRELRREWWQNLESLKGKRLTVRYQRLSDAGIPTILTGITVRDYE
jgi:DNA ligase-1